LGEETLKGMHQKAKSGLYSRTASIQETHRRAIATWKGRTESRIIVPKQRCSDDCAWRIDEMAVNDRGLTPSETL